MRPPLLVFFRGRFEEVVEVAGKPSAGRSEFVRSDSGDAPPEDESGSNSGLISVSDGLDEHQTKLLEGALAAMKEAASGSDCSEEEDDGDSSPEYSEASHSEGISEQEGEQPAGNDKEEHAGGEGKPEYSEGGASEEESDGGGGGEFLNRTEVPRQHGEANRGRVWCNRTRWHRTSLVGDCCFWSFTNGFATPLLHFVCREGY